MGTLTRTSTNYSVNKQGSAVKAEGDLSINERNEVQNMYLTFKLVRSEEEIVGSVSFSEYGGNANYNYSIQVDEHKAEIIQISDEVLKELKEQLALKEA